jgi:hypothetical protein
MHSLSGKEDGTDFYVDVAKVLSFKRIKSRQLCDRRLLKGVDQCCRYLVIRVSMS